MSKQERQSMFKIVSLIKHQPIFLYKQLDSTVNSQDIRQRALSNAISQKSKLKRSKPELSRLQVSTSGLNPLVKSYLQRRIEFSSINEKGKTEPRCLNSQDREKTQRIIREYLKIAYKKAETDRRGQAYKLPIIGCEGINQSERKKDDSIDNNGEENGPGKAVSHLKLLKRRSLHRHQPFEQSNPSELTGWDLHPIVEDF